MLECSQGVSDTTRRPNQAIFTAALTRRPLPRMGSKIVLFNASANYSENSACALVKLPLLSPHLVGFARYDLAGPRPWSVTLYAAGAALSDAAKEVHP